tara:strand:+ start:1722 stop:2735 length:1014 start_codon:yes stop_codon:yes gene_type:complete
MSKAPTVSDENYEAIRAKTLLPHESPSLFESVAEISDTSESNDDEFQDESGEAVNAFASPLSLWEMKTGRYTSTPPKSRSLWSRIKWGVMDSICEANDLESRRPAGTYIDGQIGILSSKPDMEVSDDGTNWYPMVAKNVASTMADMWRNAVGEQTPPEHMVIEGHHHMAVTGADRFYVTALFGGVSQKLFVIHRDEELVEELLGAAEDFWQCITEDRRPQPSGTRDASVMARIYAQIDPEAPVVDMRNDRDFLKAQEEKENLSKQKSKLEKRIKEINSYLTDKMDGFSSAIIDDTRQLKWVRTETKEVSFIRKASAHLRASKITEKAAGTPIQDLVE